MAKRSFLFILLAGILASIVYFLFFSQSAIEEVHDLICKELPLGSTKQQVYDFLESRAIHSSQYQTGPDPLAGLPDKDRQWKRYMHAGISKQSYIPFVSNYTINIVFYFDENLKLEEFKLQKLDDVP